MQNADNIKNILNISGFLCSVAIALSTLGQSMPLIWEEPCLGGAIVSLTVAYFNHVDRCVLLHFACYFTFVTGKTTTIKSHSTYFQHNYQSMQAELFGTSKCRPTFAPPKYAERG
jgi:hypothetical protein